MGLKPTNPWWVVVGAVTGLFVCNGPVLGFTFGVFYGYFFMVFGFGSSIGRCLGGFVYDLAGSYTPALIGAAVALVIAVGLINRLGPCAYPALRRCR